MVKLKLKGARAAVIAVLSSDEEGGNSTREISSPDVKIEYNHTSCSQEISHADLMAQLRERQQLRLQMSSEPSVLKKSWPKRRKHSSSSNVGVSQDRNACQYVAMKSEPSGSAGNDDVWWQCPVAACTYTILSNDTHRPQKKYNHSKSKACPIRNRSSEVKDESPVVEAVDTVRWQCPLNLGCTSKVQSKCIGHRRAQNKYHDKKVCAFRNTDVVLKDEKATQKTVESSTSTEEGTKKATLRHVKASMYSSRGHMLKSIWRWNRSRTLHLTKNELMKNSRGKIVSKKRSAHSRNVAASNFTEKIRLWSRCLETARKELGVIGMVFPKKTGGGEGQTLYERAKAIQRDAACAPKLD